MPPNSRQNHELLAQIGAAAGTASDTALLREINSRSILREIRNAENPMTLAHIATATGLSRPAIEGSLIHLTEQGWVRETSSIKSAGRGRPARSFEFAADGGIVVGLDVGARCYVIRAADLAGNILSENQSAISEGEPPQIERIAQHLLATVAAVAQSAAPGIKRHRGAQRHSPLISTVIGLPGIVAGSTTLTKSLVLPAWSGRNISQEFAQHLPGQIHVENDANLAAHAEFHSGAGRGATNLVSLLVGYRIAAGLILNGEIFKGSTGAAAESGALDASRWPHARRTFIAALRAAHPDIDGPVSEIKAMEETFVAAGQGDRRAQDLVASLASDFALGLAMIVLTVDPDVIVIGGRMAKAGDTFIGALKRSLDPLVYSTPEIRCAHHLENAIAVGAQMQALDHFERNVLGLLA